MDSRWKPRKVTVEVETDVDDLVPPPPKRRKGRPKANPSSIEVDITRAPSSTNASGSGSYRRDDAGVRLNPKESLPDTKISDDHAALVNDYGPETDPDGWPTNSRHDEEHQSQGKTKKVSHLKF